MHAKFPTIWIVLGLLIVTGCGGLQYAGKKKPRVLTDVGAPRGFLNLTNRDILLRLSIEPTHQEHLSRYEMESQVRIRDKDRFVLTYLIDTLLGSGYTIWIEPRFIIQECESYRSAVIARRPEVKLRSPAVEEILRRSVSQGEIDWAAIRLACVTKSRGSGFFVPGEQVELPIVSKRLRPQLVDEFGAEKFAYDYAFNPWVFSDDHVKIKLLQKNHTKLPELSFKVVWSSGKMYSEHHSYRGVGYSKQIEEKTFFAEITLVVDGEVQFRKTFAPELQYSYDEDHMTPELEFEKLITDLIDRGIN